MGRLAYEIAASLVWRPRSEVVCIEPNVLSNIVAAAMLQPSDGAACANAEDEGVYAGSACL